MKIAITIITLNVGKTTSPAIEATMIHYIIIGDNADEYNGEVIAIVSIKATIVDAAIADQNNP